MSSAALMARRWILVTFTLTPLDGGKLICAASSIRWQSGLTAGVEGTVVSERSSR